VAQSWRVRNGRSRKPRPPLDQEGLERLALFYAGRYATTRAKLGAYLARKIKERGWSGEAAADLEALAERFSGYGYVDDAAFAAARTASLMRRGYGGRRVDEALRAAGIGEEDSTEAREQARDGARAAALRFAERKRIGPYAASAPTPEARQKAFGAMMRAGHPPDLVRELLNASPGMVPDSDAE
jgi:regulatory protein